MKIKYQDLNLRQSTKDIIWKANDIIEEYEAQGFELTLRQLYYQFVARDLLANTEKMYKKLGSIVNDGRLAGLIDWNAITDRTRSVQSNSHWESPNQIIEAAARWYYLNRWVGQNYMPEVWVEKDALVGVIAKACEPYDVPYFSCRGYVSQSAMWRASKRIKMYEFKHIPRIFHLGDHDPSGIDMTRDIRERLEMFGCEVKVIRIALTMDQIEEQSPPPNPAKTSDPRFLDYRNEYGDESWELDSLEPKFLVDLIQRNIGRYLDISKFNSIERKNKREKNKLLKFAKEYK